MVPVANEHHPIEEGVHHCPKKSCLEGVEEPFIAAVILLIPHCPKKSCLEGVEEPFMATVIPLAPHCPKKSCLEEVEKQCFEVFVNPFIPVVNESLNACTVRLP